VLSKLSTPTTRPTKISKFPGDFAKTGAFSVFNANAALTTSILDAWRLWI
jgi:hypothetical protein